MRNCLTFLLFILLSPAIDGQVISGKVTTSHGNDPLPGVTVIADDSLGTITDNTGAYSLQLAPGKHLVEFRMLSFKSEKRNLELRQNESRLLDISLFESAANLNIVVISAGKFEQRLEDVTVSMEVLKPALVEKRNSVIMDEAVDNIPGVNVIDGQANIRGGSGWSYGAGSRVQILVDDLPMLTADANDAKWSFMPVENLEQVEVVKGASSVLFGSSALNGVINIRTAYPRDTALTKINSFFGVYDNASITTDKKYSLRFQSGNPTYSGINFFHSRKIKRLDLVVGGNFFNDLGYRQGENEKRGRFNFNTRYNFKTPGLSAGVNFNTMITKGTIFFLWKNDTAGAYIPALNTLSDYKTYRTNVDPFITYIGKGGCSHKIRTRWFNTTNTNNTDQDSKANLFYTEYQFQKSFKKSLTITAGIVNIFSKIKSQLYGDHDGNQHAGYIQGDFQWKKLTLSAGSRLEKNSVDELTDKWTTVYRAGANYHILNQTYLRASAGQGYRFPSVAERFIKTSIGGVNIFPNPELQPEKGISMEAGIKQVFRFGKWTGYADVALFENDYKNMMEFVFALWGTTHNLFADNGFKSVNIGKTRIRGGEITVAGEGKISKDFSIALQIGYTYLDPRQLTYDSAYALKIGPANVKGTDSTDFLKYRYRHMVKGNIEIIWRKISLGMDIRFTSRMENIDNIFTSQFLDFSFQPGLGIGDYRKYHRKGDLIADVRYGYQLTKGLGLSLIIKNVLNHIYMQRPADMQPPRSIVLQASLKF